MYSKNIAVPQTYSLCAYFSSPAGIYVYSKYPGFIPNTLPFILNIQGPCKPPLNGSLIADCRTAN